MAVTGAVAQPADGLRMIHSFSGADELPDAVVCGRCGHPIWDQRVNATCAECACRDLANACSLNLLNDFRAEPATASDDAQPV